MTKAQQLNSNFNDVAIKVGDYVVTSKGYAGNVTSIGTGQHAGIITIALPQLGAGKGISVFAYDACKARIA